MHGVEKEPMSGRSSNFLFRPKISIYNLKISFGWNNALIHNVEHRTGG